MDEATQARLDAASAANPKRRLVVADGPTGPIILGNPKRQAYLYYRTLLRSEDPVEQAKAPDELLLSCAVDPSRTEIMALLEEYPAMAGHASIQAAIGELVGTVTKK